ncbi:hypothetical protein O0I10_011223 [Lichtheimia ornata]|uniref:peptidylprolyl isomerase n=1 Tax=Lichtheimia ornata TaxID=688661 RepID=A0AAD7UUV5_9FUNG|nr:uncharacterized protein O0I10_011223 [Lichtheimia ornata]KAJ8653174.1 hypothetical protein O0I10_011223 [Lichtheimia ornata]
MSSTPENLTSDGKVTKRIIKEGLGAVPKSKSQVSVHYDAYLVKGNTKFDSSRDRKVPFEFKLEGGQVIKAWEIAVPTMKVGEVAEIVCDYEYGYGAKGRNPLVPPKASLRFEVELLGTWEPAASAKQRLEMAASKKQEGNDLFKKGDVEHALLAYKKGREYIIDLWDCEPEETVLCRELVIALQSNVAMCYLKLRQWDNSIEVCKKVLDRDPCNVKACFRIGQACIETARYEEGLEFVKLGLQAHPEDTNLIAMEKAINKRINDYDRSSKAVYRKMFS